MMHNAIAHHLLRYAHPVPEQKAATPSPSALILLFSMFSMVPYWFEISLGSAEIS